MSGFENHLVDNRILGSFGSVLGETPEFDARVNIGGVELLVNVFVGFLNQEDWRSDTRDHIALSDSLSGRSLRVVLGSVGNKVSSERIGRSGVDGPLVVLASLTGTKSTHDHSHKDKNIHFFHL